MAPWPRSPSRPPPEFTSRAIEEVLGEEGGLAALDKAFSPLAGRGDGGGAVAFSSSRLRHGVRDVHKSQRADGTGRGAGDVVVLGRTPSELGGVWMVQLGVF